MNSKKRWWWQQSTWGELVAEFLGTRIIIASGDGVVGVLLDEADGLQRPQQFVNRALGETQLRRTDRQHRAGGFGQRADAGSPPGSMDWMLPGTAS